MKIYLAGSMKFRDFFRDEVTPLINEVGYQITSRWLIQDQSEAKNDEENAEWAYKDYSDIIKAQAVVLFPKESSSGGLHVELGIALGLGKLIFVIGERPNVFYFDKRVIFFDDLDKFLDHLEKRKDDQVPYSLDHLDIKHAPSECCEGSIFYTENKTYQCHICFIEYYIHTSCPFAGPNSPNHRYRCIWCAHYYLEDTVRDLKMDLENLEEKAILKENEL